MILRNFGKTISWAAAAAVMSCAVAGATAPNVTYTANGTFANPQSSGADTLKLAGEPFSITIVANTASVPIQHGRNWAVMSPFKMTGSVHSGLLGPTPINIASNAASILELVGPDFDIFETAFPVVVIGISLTINATITMPAGTITKPLIHPFSPVTLAPGNATVSYSNGTDTSVLAVDSGTLTATIPTATAAQASLTSPALTGGGNPSPSGYPAPAEPVALVAFTSLALDFRSVVA